MRLCKMRPDERRIRSNVSLVAVALVSTALALPAGVASAAVSTGDYVGKSKTMIARSLKREGYKVLEFETESGLIEVEVTYRGKQYEIVISPKTGRILGIGIDD